MCSALSSDNKNRRLELQTFERGEKSKKLSTRDTQPVSKSAQQTDCSRLKVKQNTNLGSNSFNSASKHFSHSRNIQKTSPPDIRLSCHTQAPGLNFTINLPYANAADLEAYDSCSSSRIRWTRPITGITLSPAGPDACLFLCCFALPVAATMASYVSILHSKHKQAAPSLRPSAQLVDIIKATHIFGQVRAVQ
ncbi:unnamed protein product [Peronospora belbahrii]|uniref:Uncharacterized protein n=1 Tax=Peronospora belbahrii TaxID=622444 RepID=A0ABN8CQX9_9STRA|nr:unnamed protein product [Peronospora belbahrii]